MSMVTTNVASLMESDAQASIAGAGAQKKAEVKRRRKQPYKARLATKVKWALGDIMEASLDAQRRMENMWLWMDEARAEADTTGNTALLALLGKFDHEMVRLGQDVSKMVQGATQAIAESKPQVEEKKKYSELSP